jgi:hypothetical protein
VHIDDLAIEGTENFVKNLTLSKVVKGSLRFCGLDLCQKDGKTILSMEDYATSMFIAPIPEKNASLTAKQQT